MQRSLLNEADDLIAEVEQLIGPSGGLQVMQPSQNVQTSDNPSSNAIFDGLRRQLDDIQGNLRRGGHTRTNNSRSPPINLVEPETSTNMSWRERAMINHRREQRGNANARFENNPRLYGHVRSNRNQAVNNQLNNLRELRRNM